MVNEEKLDRILLDLGHDDFNRGTAYIRQAVGIYQPGMFMTKELYPTLAAAAHSTPARVERCMRHSIEKAWSRGSQEARITWFGGSTNPETGKPTTGEYVARLAKLCREGLDI